MGRVSGELEMTFAPDRARKRAMKPRAYTCSGAFFALAALMTASACGRAGAPEPQLADAKRDLPEGAQVYVRECQGCHGANGEGVDGKPAVMGSGALPERRRAKGSLSGSPDQPGRVSAGTGGQEDARPPFKTAKDLHDYIASSMPLPTPGLSPKESWAVTSFILKAHGVNVPAGGLTEQTAAALTLHP